MIKLTNDEVEFVASVVHNVNKLFCETNGDYSQKIWQEAPQWQKDCVIDGVKKMMEHNMNVDPKALHNNWVQHKLKAGWTYGEVKDEQNQTHPNLVPYNELSESEKFKDILFKISCGYGLSTLNK